jgi:hypothetical protein
MGLESLTMSTGTPESLGSPLTESSVRPTATGQESSAISQVSDFQIALQRQQNALSMSAEVPNKLTEASQEASEATQFVVEANMEAPEANKTETKLAEEEENTLLDPSLLLNFMISAPASPPLPVAVSPIVKDEMAVHLDAPTSPSTLASAPSGSLALPADLELTATQELPEEIQAAIDALSDAAAPTVDSPKPAPTLAPVPAVESPNTSVGGAFPTASTAPQEADATPKTPAAVRLPELSQQLVPILRRVNTEGRQELRVRLDPPHLGELNVIVEDGLDGISVRIVAESRETLLLLQDQRSQLHDELSRQNLSVTSFSASLAGDTSGQRSPSRFFAAPAHRSLQDAAVPETEALSVVARIPLTVGGLDVHA